MTEDELKDSFAKVINSIIDKRGLTQRAAAKILEIDQPKVSRLKSLELYSFSITKLMLLLNLLDMDVEIKISPSKGEVGAITFKVKDEYGVQRIVR
jgi:predicted XRE-type DNA-binding protein